MIGKMTALLLLVVVGLFVCFLIVLRFLIVCHFHQINGNLFTPLDYANHGKERRPPKIICAIFSFLLIYI